jgi:hypothetical protein
MADAEVEAEDKSGRTAHITAALSGYTKIVDRLLAKGAVAEA